MEGPVTLPASFFKSGSRWQGEIVSVHNGGRALSNVPAIELMAFAKSAKIVFKVGKLTRSIRGLSSSFDKKSKYQWHAISAEHGFVEFVWGDGETDPSREHLISKGDSVTVLFQV